MDLVNKSIHSVITAIKKNQKMLPPLRFDCGKSDGVIKGNRLLQQQLLDLNIPHTYGEFEGGYEQHYWQKHV